MMQPRRRQPPAPWERNPQAPRHPTGNARRRWPRAYDGGVPIPPPTRYRRAYDGASDRRVEEGVRLPRRSNSAMARLRRHPVRHGLIGLGIAGASVPIAVGRQHTAMRTDPSHEQTLAHAGTASRISDSAVTRAWRNAIADSAELLAGTEAKPVASAAGKAAAVGVNATSAAREAKIAANLEKYKSYDVPRDLAETIYDLALQSDIDPDMAFGLVRTESAFKNHATSHVGAMGLTQLMPATARWLEPGTTKSDLRDPDTNLRIGFRYLRDLIDKYDGNTRLALLAYNRGPGTVDRILKRGGDPNNGYADMVLRGKAH